MAREVFATDWIKLEVIGDDDLLQPDVFGLVEAAGILVPRRLPGLSLYDRGFARGREARRRGLRSADAVGRADRLGHAGSTMSSACRRCANIFRPCRSSSTPASARRRMRLRPWSSAMMACCSIRRSPRPAIPCMARAFAHAVEAGRLGYCADPIPPRDMAEPSTPQLGRAFSDLSKRA